MNKIILASHGEFSKGLKNSLEMIVGNLAQSLDTFSLYPGQSPDEYKEKMEKEIQNNPEITYYFLCDLVGGSVCNALSQLNIYPNVHVFGGSNMPLAMDLLLSQPKSLEELTETARQGVACTGTLAESVSDDEDF